MLAVEHFERALDRFPDRNIVFSSEGAITYAEMAIEVAKITNAIIRSGIEPGAHIATLSPNHGFVLACQYALLKAGCVWVPLNYRNTAAETGRQISSLDIKLVFHHASLRGYVEEALGASADVALVAFGGDPSGPSSIEAWTTAAEPGAALPVGHADDPVIILTTGGTTGPSKGAMHSNKSWETLIASYWATHHFSRPIVHLVVSPLTHAAGVYHWTVLGKGATNVIAPDADPETIMRMIQEHKVTMLFLPTTIMYMMLAHPRVRDYDYSSLEYFLIGAAPVSPDKLKEAVGVFGPVCYQCFGQSETLMMCTIMPREEVAAAAADPALEHRLASVGREGPFSRVEIMDDAGTLLPRGERGEMVCQGNFMMQGYYNNPAKTAEVRCNGWHRTGDIAYKDADGYVYLVDRKNDMIISGGFNIYPADIEQAAMAHPAVQNCAVVGIPHEKWGEAVLAALELKPGSAFDETEFLAFCKARVGSVKTPKFVEVVAELPRSPVGKILRRAVRDKYWSDQSRAV
jgi:acyl-CoA synthetase (AMP-forming)/AMP-acid ligase II